MSCRCPHLKGARTGPASTTQNSLAHVAACAHFRFAIGADCRASPLSSMLQGLWGSWAGRPRSCRSSWLWACVCVCASQPRNCAPAPVEVIGPIVLTFVVLALMASPSTLQNESRARFTTAFIFGLGGLCLVLELRVCLRHAQLIKATP